MAETAIEWADDTINVASGCTEHRRLDGSMDPACVNCYARLMSARCASMGQALYEGAAVRRGNTATWTGDLRWDPDLLDRRMDAIRPGKITFLGSMTDLWHERADPAMWAAVAAAARRISARPARRWPRGVVTLTKRTDGLLVFQREFFPEGLPAWWWPGCTVADQVGVNLRAADLMRVDFDVPKGDDGIRVVSYEPAMGPVDLDPFLWVCPTCGPGGKADGDGGCYHCNEPLRAGVERATGRHTMSDYEDGQNYGSNIRMFRCKQDIARALRLSGERPPSWEELVLLVSGLRASLKRANQEVARLRAERDRLRAILDAETGKRAPEGWTWRGTFWVGPDRRGVERVRIGRIDAGGYAHTATGQWCMERFAYALEAIEAADRVAGCGA